MTTTEQPTIQQVDPRNLQLEDNVRTEASLTKDFVANIKELGVLMPVVAVRNPDGTLMVRAGQRRTAAAREAGLESIPVYITGQDTDDASRLVTQIVENDQRLGLRNDDRVAGIQALIDTGMSVTKIAKKLSIPSAQVKKSSAVARSKVALEALQAESVTLDEAAAIAEFEDDPAIVERLVNAAKRNYFDHELARQQADRETRKVYEQTAEVYAKRGLTVLSEHPEDRWSLDLVSQFSLVTPSGDDLDAEAVQALVDADPSKWAVRLEEEAVFTDSEGNTVPDSAIDWATEADPDAEPEEGFVHASSVTETVVFLPVEYYCLDTEAVGLGLSERFQRDRARREADPTSAPTPTLAEREAEKRERRKVLALNKAGDAAVGVRRAFVTTLLQRKTTPKGASVFVARMLTADPGLLSGYLSASTAAELLGVEADQLAPSVAGEVTPQRAEVVTLALVLGALEVRAPKGAWRAPSAHPVGPKEYLGFLAECGYSPSVVEQVMAGAKSSDEALEEITHDDHQ